MLFKEKKLSTNFKGFIVITIALFILLVLYFMTNYNRFGIYEYSFNNQVFASDNGIAYFTPSKREIVLSNIYYLKDDIKIKKMAIGIYYKSNDVYNEITSTSADFGQRATSINEYLGTVVLNYEEKKAKKLTTGVELFFRENTYIKISITKEDNTELNYEIKISANKIANSKLFY